MTIDNNKINNRIINSDIWDYDAKEFVNSGLTYDEKTDTYYEISLNANKQKIAETEKIDESNNIKKNNIKKDEKKKTPPKQQQIPQQKKKNDEYNEEEYYDEDYDDKYDDLQDKYNMNYGR